MKDAYTKMSQNIRKIRTVQIHDCRTAFVSLIFLRRPRSEKVQLHIPLFIQDFFIPFDPSPPLLQKNSIHSSLDALQRSFDDLWGIKRNSPVAHCAEQEKI